MAGQDLATCLRINLDSAIADGGHKNLAHLFPAIETLDLSKDAIETVMKHPGLSQLAGKLKNGKGVTFQLLGIRNRFKIAFTSRGEAIQSYFLYKVLKARFPEAEFIMADEKPGIPDNKVFKIFVADSAEMGSKSKYGTIEMSLLKNGNPTASSISRNNTRAAFGLRPSDRVVHLYTGNRVGYGSRLSPLDLMAQVSEGATADVIFQTSFTMEKELPQYTADLLNTKKYSGVYLLSKITPLEVRSLLDNRPDKRPIVIINDLTGYKTYLDAASNLSVVVGPVNHSESLSVGTPVVSLINEQVRGIYNLEVLEHMLSQLEFTGGLVRVSDSGRPLINAISKAFGTTKVTRPPHLIPTSGANSKTPFDLVLDELWRNIASSSR